MFFVFQVVSTLFPCLKLLLIFCLSNHSSYDFCAKDGLLIVLLGNLQLLPFTLQDQDPVLVAVREHCTLTVMWETAAACPVDKDCVFGDSDFSSLRHPDYYEVETADRQKFLLNLCGPVRSGACSNTSLVAVCKIDKNNKTIIGHLDGHRVELLKSTGLTLIYTTFEKGEQCVQGVAWVHRALFGSLVSEIL
jgi:hypothetical protein